jgi:hypothetical protein
LDRAVWDPGGDPAARGIMSLVAVHRLREVARPYGFTRFEPAPLATDDLEDVGLAVSGVPLAQMPDWLPAVEQFGEGFSCNSRRTLWRGGYRDLPCSRAPSSSRAGQVPGSRPNARKAAWSARMVRSERQIARFPGFLDSRGTTSF